MALRGVAGQANTSASTSVTVTVSGIGGTGPQLNDVVLFFMNGGGNFGNATLSPPSGFSPVTGTSSQGVGGAGSQGSVRVIVWYKIAGSSEPATYTATSDTNDFQSAEVRVYSGRNTSAPFTAVQATLNNATNSSPLTLAFTGLTAAAGDDLVVLFGNSNWNTSSPSFSVTPPSGFANGNTYFAASTAYTTPVLGFDKVNTSAGATGTVGGTETFSGPSNVSYGGWLISLAASGPSAAPFILPDLAERITTKVIASDFSPPNLLADQILKQPPFIQKELPGWAIRAKGNYTDFAPPNLLAEQSLKLPPFTQAELPGVMLRARGITDYIHPNLIESTLLPSAPPLAPVDLSQQVKYRWNSTDFNAPNLCFTLPVVTRPVVPQDFSLTFNARWAGSDFFPQNLLTGHLPTPPIAPVDATITIRAKGVFTDFSPPNLSLSTLVPPTALYPIDTAVLRLEYRWIRGDDIPLNLLPLRLQTVTPIAAQDLSGIRVEARGVRSDFAPPNLTLFLPVPPPTPTVVPAGRHGTRAQARRRRQLDVLRANLDAFKEQKAEADRALLTIEDRELTARAKLLKRIRVKPLTKPIEQYAPVKKAIAQRAVATERHRSILEQIRAHQLEAERIERELAQEAADEEAALHLMHYLMMESWYE